MQVEVRRISDLTADPENARTHDKKNLDAIASSLEKFGQRKPIVVMPTGVILAGNGTWAAAKQLGWTEITVSVTPPEWDYATAKAYALADNRTAELADWDTSVLASQLIELDAEGWDITALGFDLPEQTPELNEDEGPLTFDEEAEPITKLGDVYQLGRHRLMCGDSMDASALTRLMNGQTIETIVTDPPYGMAFVSNYRQQKHKAIENDTTVDALLYTCNIEASHSKYIFCRWDNLKDVPKPTSVVTWVKNNWSMGDLEHSHARQTEVALFYPGVNHSFPNGRPTDVVNHARTNNELHPTQKPIELITEVIGWTSGIVLDLFAGSGGTIVAAEQLGRTCYAIELDPKYCDVIVKRWEALTGQKAQLL